LLTVIAPVLVISASPVIGVYCGAVPAPCPISNDPLACAKQTVGINSRITMRLRLNIYDIP
jgi:hypothetical protein